MSYGTEDHKHDAYDVYGVADEHHRHYDAESEIRGLREDLSRAEERIRELADQLGDALGRISALEKDTPHARQLQLEADQAAADLRASGYVEGLTTECRDRWHDRCPPGVLYNCYCHVAGEDQAGEFEPAECDPGPEVDDEGGMSEYRYTLPEDYQRGQS